MKTEKLQRDILKNFLATPVSKNRPANMIWQMCEKGGVYANHIFQAYGQQHFSMLRFLRNLFNIQ